MGLLLVIVSFAVLNNEERFEFITKFDHDTKTIEESVMLQSEPAFWLSAFSPENPLLVDVDPKDLVLTTSCPDAEETATYQLAGTDAVLVGEGDMHDEVYNAFVHTFILSSPETSSIASGCVYTFHVYAAEDFSASGPMFASFGVCLLFVVLITGYYRFDAAWKQRNDKLIRFAQRSNGVLSTLFPKTVRDKLVQEYDQGKRKGVSHEQQLKKLVEGSVDDDERSEDGSIRLNEESIAELFPSATVRTLCRRIQNIIHPTSSHCSHPVLPGIFRGYCRFYGLEFCTR